MLGAGPGAVGWLVGWKGGRSGVVLSILGWRGGVRGEKIGSSAAELVNFVLQMGSAAGEEAFAARKWSLRWPNSRFFCSDGLRGGWGGCEGANSFTKIFNIACPKRRSGCLCQIYAPPENKTCFFVSKISRMVLDTGRVYRLCCLRDRIGAFKTPHGYRF